MSLDRLKGESGFVLFTVISFTFVFTMMIAGLAVYSTSGARQTLSQEEHIRVFYMSEAASEKGYANVRLFLEKTGRMPTEGELNALTPPYSSGNYNFSDYDVDLNGGLEQQVLENGDYAGLNGAVQRILVRSTANSAKNPNIKITMRQNAEAQFIPLFQFGVFYQNDLEILPGPAMTFLGAVHSNSDIYVGTHNSLDFRSTITSTGSLYHGRKDSGESMSGDVRIEDTSGSMESMRNSDGSWLDSNHENWILGSGERWGGQVLSSAHNTRSLNLPLPTESQSRTLISRRSGSESDQVKSQMMDYKAQIRIVDGVVKDQGGAPVYLQYCSAGGEYNPSMNSCPEGQTIVNPIQSSQFYNWREGKTVQTTDLDMTLLKQSPAFQGIQNANNGVIIYHSDHRNLNSSVNQDGLRLLNGESLPDKGITVSTENPLYVKGSYNSVDKKPAGLVADAVTVLSGSWQDVASFSGSLGDRIASSTTVQAAIIAGNTETVTGQYNGGFENALRLLEDWGGRTLTYKGSMVMLYNSGIATGNWVYGGSQYTAPTRNWGFDTDYLLPNYGIPGLPNVYNLTRTIWEVD